ncbi:protein sidekick-2-like, partial [Catharus ustulatus]|uniref:protein sidekick-2-like n=1 Tax=Catharus ustulatus TaxID=91951 RepID=UPI001409DE77
MLRTSSQRMRSSILFTVPFQGSDSEYEVDPGHQKGISRAQAYSYTESDSGEPEHTPLSHSTSTQQGSLFRPKASRTPTPQTPGNAPAASRDPVKHRQVTAHCEPPKVSCPQ